MRRNVTPSSFLAVHFSTTMRFVVLRVDEDAAAFSSVGSGRICQACCFHFVYAALLELLPLSEHTAHKLGVTSYFFLFSNLTPLRCTMYAIFSSQQPLLLHIGGSSEPNCQSCCVAVCCCCLRFIQTIKHTGTEVIASLFHQAFTHTHTLSLSRRRNTEKSSTKETLNTLFFCSAF